MQGRVMDGYRVAVGDDIVLLTQTMLMQRYGEAGVSALRSFLVRCMRHGVLQYHPYTALASQACKQTYVSLKQAQGKHCKSMGCLI